MYALWCNSLCNMIMIVFNTLWCACVKMLQKRLKCVHSANKKANIVSLAIFVPFLLSFPLFRLIKISTFVGKFVKNNKKG